jgi:predicted RNA-binding protein with PUA-like domain
MTSHWLMKSEPDVFSIDDLARDRTTSWEGVRNYTARNFMRDGMKLGDLVLYYHSNAEPSGVAGIAKVSRLAYADPTQFDPKSEYYDEGASKDEPRWLMVDVAFVEKFPAVVSLEDIKNEKSLATMLVVQKGQRLSVQPVEAAHFERVVAMGRTAAAAPSAAKPTSAKKPPTRATTAATKAKPAPKKTPPKKKR